MNAHYLLFIGLIIVVQHRHKLRPEHALLEKNIQLFENLLSSEELALYAARQEGHNRIGDAGITLLRLRKVVEELCGWRVLEFDNQPQPGSF